MTESPVPVVRIPLARILRPWGRRGAVIARLSTEDPKRFLGAEDLILEGPERGALPVRVAEARQHGEGRAVLKLEGTDSIEKADLLRGATIYATAAPAGFLPEGAHYAFQLIGLQVVTVDGMKVGRVEDIRETAGPDLLVVRDGARARLIPFVEAICRRVDVEGGLIEIDPPEGLLELDEI